MVVELKDVKTAIYAYQKWVSPVQTSQLMDF